jgi:vacuolar iron transporter family protein
MKTKRELKRTLENWREEKEAAYIFGTVAQHEKDPKRKEIFTKFASIEEEHAEMWQGFLVDQGILPRYVPRLRTRCLLFFVRLFGRAALIDALDRLKRAKIRAYFDQLESVHSAPFQENVKKLFAIEKSHTTVLDYLNDRPLSPYGSSSWHKTGVGIREIIFGMNDGLLSIFSFIAGLAGGRLDSAVVLFPGLAATIAGAISMAAGAFVSTRAEREVMELQLKIEKRELELMPQVEKQELSALYKQKGLSLEQADSVAETIISNKDIALNTMAREELGFDPEKLSNPFKASVLTGSAFIVGALFPIAPFIFLGNAYAFPAALFLSMAGFFIIGSVRTIVTGKNPVLSGLEMLCIGAGASGITFLIGKWIGLLL